MHSMMRRRREYLVNTHLFTGNGAQAAQDWDAGLEYCRSVNDKRREASKLLLPGGIYFNGGDKTSAKESLQQAAGLARACGDKRLGAASLQTLACRVKSEADDELGLFKKAFGKRGQATMLQNGSDARFIFACRAAQGWAAVAQAPKPQAMCRSRR